MMKLPKFLAGVAALLVAVAGTAQQVTAPDNTDSTRKSATGLFVVSYSPQLDPLVINQIHSWRFHVATAEGDAVEDAEIELVGGMPIHDHGLPTLPQNTRHLGEGDYLVEGMKFHMNGWWQVVVTVNSEGRSDSVTFNLVL